jgi:hypothetical protein
VVADFGQQTKRVSGTLLACNPNIILQTNQGVVILNKISAIDLSSVPDGFFTVPTLNWKVYSTIQQTSKCEVAYRTSGFQWKADYTITVNDDQSKADFGGWVTIDNNSGKKYETAKLKLIAGDVNTVSSITRPMMYAVPSYANDQMAMSGAAPSFSEQSFADYHMYTLSNPVNLN